MHGSLKTVLSDSGHANVASCIVFGITFCACSGSGNGTVEISPQYFIFRIKSWHRGNTGDNCD